MIKLEMRYFMREERGMAFCGLACCVCSESDCPGCHARGCEHKAMCGILDCCLRKGSDGCYACDEFPCDEEMLKKLSIYSAFELYLDFINIFLYILRFVGNRD